MKSSAFISMQRYLSHALLALVLLLAQWVGVGHGLSHVAPQRGGHVMQSAQSVVAGEEPVGQGQHVCLDCLAYSALDTPLSAGTTVLPAAALGWVSACFVFCSWAAIAPRFFLSRAPPFYS